MPLSVPLKTSRTAAKGVSHGAASQAIQAAAQLAAQSGAQANAAAINAAASASQNQGAAPAASNLPAEAAAPAAPVAPATSVGPTVPAAPIPPATGAVWGHNVSASSVARQQAAAVRPRNDTPQAVLRSFEQHEREREAKHWDSKGKQVTSGRATCPSVSFHNGPSGRVVEEKARCREIGEHPNLRNPGPECYSIEPTQPVCMVPKGWAREARFKNSPFAVQQVDNPTKLIKFSTDAHPLSQTYPYQEPKFPKPLPAPESDAGEASVAAQEVPVAEKTSPSHPPPQRELEPDELRRNPIRGVDLNIQHFKYNSKPTWGFGSSGLGFRFMPGTPFAKQPAIKPHSRLRGFRELRESIPDPSEKHYQEAFEKALAEAERERALAEAAAFAEAAAAVAEAAAASSATASEASKRKSGAGNLGEEKRSGSIASADAAAAVGTAATAAVATDAAAVPAPADASREQPPDAGLPLVA